MLRLYDCFTFFNELDLLEIRLNELKDVVHRFVLCESPLTFSGTPKPLYYAENIERFKQFSDRIIHLVCDLPVGPGIDSWARERHQRNYLWQAITDIADDVVVSISDLDEIPKAEVVARIVSGEISIPCTTRVTNHYFYVDWRSKLPGSSPCFFHPTHVYQFGGSIQKVRENRELYGAIMIDDGAWHFGWLGEHDKVFLKSRSFAHTEFNQFSETDVAAWLKNGVTFDKEQLVSVIPSGPRYLLDNAARFAHLFSPEARKVLGV